MRKLAPAQVSYRDDFLILYRLYIIMGHFISRLFEGILHVDKRHVRLKIANSTHALPVPNRWSFCIYMIPLQNFALE